MKDILKIFLLPLKFASLLLCIALIFSISACYVTPAKYWLLQFFGLFFQIIFILNVLALIFWSFTKSKLKYIHLAIVILGVLYLGRFIQFAGSTSDDADSIKIITYNVYDFKEYNDTKIRTHNEISEFLLAENPDIICLQEYNVPQQMIDENIVLQKLVKQYKYACNNNSGEKILSKYPFVENDKFTIKDTPVTFANININGKIVRIYNCHLQSTSFNPEVSQKKLADETTRSSEVIQVSSKLKKAFVKRAKQVDDIAAHISKSPYPTIVCGDFNDTPMSYTYQKMRGKMRDAFVGAGSGMPHTYRKLLSLLRIDYVFANKNFDALEYKIAKQIKHSDHYPVVVKLKLTKNEK